MKVKTVAASVVAAVGVLISAAGAGDYPFSDDFSNPVQTQKAWSQLPIDTLVTKVCQNGVLTLTNKQQNNPAVVYHVFSDKVSTFTASCVVTRSSDSVVAGMWLCMNIPTTTGDVTGYVVQLNGGGYMTVFKGKTQLFGSDYPRYNLTDTIKVSKQGNNFTVFCNGRYIGGCVDNSAPIASGDFGLYVSANATAVFDDVLFTDQFTPGGYPGSFTDKFNDSKLGGAWIASPANAVKENDSVLSVSVPKPTDVSCYVKLAVPDTFAMRGIVSWRSGDSASWYGTYLHGGIIDDTLRIVSFGICGAQLGSIFRPAISFTPKFSPKINGKALLLSGMTDTAFFKDTIDVFKKAGSGSLVMAVNGYRLDSLPLSAISFPLTGAGIFCMGGQHVFFDYFHFGPSLSESKILPVPYGAKQFKRLVFSPYRGDYLVDPLGRILRLRGAHGRLVRPAPGMYIAPNGTAGVVLKKQ